MVHNQDAFDAGYATETARKLYQNLPPNPHEPTSRDGHDWYSGVWARLDEKRAAFLKDTH